MPKKETIYQSRYDAKNTRRYVMKLNLNTDADIIAKLESERAGNKIQTYLKRLIRADLASAGASESDR